MPVYPTVSVPRLHTEYHLWISEITFFSEEIKIFESHLQKMISKDISPSNLKCIEQFRANFNDKKEVINQLKWNLHQAEKGLTSFVHQMSGMGLCCVKMDNHCLLREEVHLFKKDFTKLKIEFRAFEVRCLFQKNTEAICPVY